MLVAHVIIEARQHLVALGLLFSSLLWIWKQQIFAEVSPEQVFHEAHRLGLRAEQRLGLLDHLPVLLRNALERLEVGHDSSSVGSIQRGGRPIYYIGRISGRTNRFGLSGEDPAAALRYAAA